MLATICAWLCWSFGLSAFITFEYITPAAAATTRRVAGPTNDGCDISLTLDLQVNGFVLCIKQSSLHLSTDSQGEAFVCIFV